MYLEEKRKKKAKIIAHKNGTPHKLSWQGYDLLERRIVEKKVKDTIGRIWFW